MKYFQLFRVTGVANTIAYDGGLKSTETEKKRLIAVHLELDKYAATDDNEIQGWHERSKICEFPEKLFNTELYSAVVAVNTKVKMDKILVDLDIPTGETFKIAIKCAATAVNIRGVYEYEMIA